MEETGKSEKYRKRSPNFNEKEIRLLMRLALENRKIIENKKTDAVTWKMKNKTWKEVAIKFNANSGKVYRPSSNLKMKYEQMKKILKRKVTKNRQMNKTGGGTPDYLKLEWYEEELLIILGTQVHGLSSQNDSDSIGHETGIISSNSGLACTQDKKIKNEVVNGDNFEEAVICCSGNVNPTNLTNLNVQAQSDFSSEPTTSIENTENETMNSTCINKETNHKNQNSCKNKWTSWTPANLKPKRQRACEILNNKIDTVLDSRDELIKLQIEYVKREEERKQKEHEHIIEKLTIEKRLLLLKEEHLKIEHRKRMEVMNSELL